MSASFFNASNCDFKELISLSAFADLLSLASSTWLVKSFTTPLSSSTLSFSKFSFSFNSFISFFNSINSLGVHLMLGLSAFPFLISASTSSQFTINNYSLCIYFSISFCDCVRSMDEKSVIRVKFFSTLRSIMKTDFVDIEISKDLGLHALFHVLNEKIFSPKNYTILSKNQSDLVPGILCLIDGVDYRLWMEDHTEIGTIKEITFISSLHGG